ncbi:MAG: RlmE family RNA methyltransferase [Alphaproteobacteria bacterium]|nr:RlmE family RNA methyltransferase [Alphaproteobacteria bacterium]
MTPPKKKGGSGRGQRLLHTRVKTAKGRKKSSTRWLERQLNDPYVARAKAEGYRSRAAYKLIELDDKFHFLHPNQTVLDLGAAPGGWTQVAVERLKDKGKVLGIDLLEMDSIPGATLMVLDFLKDDAPDIIREALGGRADVVLSDMAPSTTGHAATDHLRIMAMCELAFHFAIEVLKPGGSFVAKVFKGGTENALLASMKQHFSVVKHAKPPASRKDSSEAYVIAMGFKG